MWLIKRVPSTTEYRPKDTSWEEGETERERYRERETLNGLMCLSTDLSFCSVGINYTHHSLLLHTILPSQTTWGCSFLSWNTLLVSTSCLRTQGSHDNLTPRLNKVPLWVSPNACLRAGKKKMGFLRIPADIRLIISTFCYVCLSLLLKSLLCNSVRQRSKMRCSKDPLPSRWERQPKSSH